MVRSDEELVAAALAGNDDAFTELVRRYQERLLRYLLTRCRGRADAEDALQDTFINAYRYLYSFDPGRRFSTWLYSIAIRNAAATKRSAGHDEPAIAGMDDPLDACIAAGERENLWRTARTVLSDDAYTAMWLHYVEDMSQRDIARAMERSLPWTKVTLMRGRRRLQTAMTAESQHDKRSEAYGQAR